MKRKGFTLIELLAVIVILAIIALIAVPLVLNTIEDARKGAAEVSALAYVDAIEKYIVKSMIDPSKPQLQAGVEYQLSSTNYEVAALANPETVFINDLIEIKGDKPESGYVIVNTNGTVEKIEMIMNDYPVMCTGENCNVVEKEYEAYNVADAVTIDGVGYHVIKTSSKYDEYVTLLRDESIGEFAFDENGGTDYETSTIKTYLNSTYKETFGDNKSYIKEITLLDFGNYEALNNSNQVNLVGSEEGTYTDLYKNYKDIFFTVSSSQNQGEARECHYNEQTGEYDICTNVYTNMVDLFWTKTPHYETSIIVGIHERVNSDTSEHWYYILMTNDPKGSEAETEQYDEDGNLIGARAAYNSRVRPVVVISKEALK